MCNQSTKSIKMTRTNHWSDNGKRDNNPGKQGVVMGARWLSAEWSRLVAGLVPAAHRFLRRWRSAGMMGRYRPERHYMRGSGPKHRSKARAE
jgi:hypothetical protein